MFHQMKTPQKSLSATMLLLAASAGVMPVSTMADTFGTGGNTFTMDFVTIGNPGNAPDTTGAPNPAGSVGYVFQIGTYEVSRDMITKANNAGSLGLSLADMATSGSNGANRPATGVSWNEAARFVNWLNESSGFSAAYKFSTQPTKNGYVPNESLTLWQAGDAGYNAANPYRNSNAHYFLPSTDEWYKAAYYNSGNNTYFDVPTGSSGVPGGLWQGVAGGTTPGTAVYNQPYLQGPADVENAGGLSPYGTMGQGGNVFEWNETDLSGINDDAESARVIRGGAWGSNFLGQYDVADTLSSRGGLWCSPSRHRCLASAEESAGSVKNGRLIEGFRPDTKPRCSHFQKPSRLHFW